MHLGHGMVHLVVPSIISKNFFFKIAPQAKNLTKKLACTSLSRRVSIIVCSVLLFVSVSEGGRIMLACFVVKKREIRMRNAGPRDDGTSGVMFCVCRGYNVVLCSSR